MFPWNSEDYPIYIQQLEKLADPLQRLASKRNVKVIWMLNQDIVDIAINPASYQTLPITIHKSKTRQYNKLARASLRR